MAKATFAGYIRFPVELYPALREKAKEKQCSVNSLVVEAVRKLLGVNEKRPGA